MKSKLENKIEAKDINVDDLLKGKKFYIDYFQREYRWKEKHIKLFIDDLTTTFLKSYDPNHKRALVEHYQNYYLGPVIFSVNQDDGKRSIIDGQQRITSITLLLIYLKHLQNNNEKKVSINELIFSEKYDDKSFNMTDKLREPCLKALFDKGEYEIQENDNETICNMVERYEDINQSFPEELTQEALPYFIDWFIRNVVIVEITAYSDENAYTIFETMNDRGLNLTPTEMLKGYVLSKITDADQRIEINDIWRLQIQKLHSYDETADQSFFHAWFRGKYAVNIRPGKAGAENQDFELIGVQFHNWFRDNHKKQDFFNLQDSDEFVEYFRKIFPFYVKWYLKIWDAQVKYTEKMPHLYYINHWGIAESLQEPLLLSSIKFEDSEDEIKKKLDYTARYIETFTVRRSVNYKRFGHTSIKYTMFNLMKLTRNSELTDLAAKLSNEINGINQKWDGVAEFTLHGQNKKFVKHLLSRISGYVDELVGESTDYVSYHHPKKGKPFQIEHIWGDKFEEHSEIEQESDFQWWRNSIGALILLPKGTNQSFGSDKYEEKLEHYIRENTYVKTLCPGYYKRNPNFLKSPAIEKLKFKPHPAFKVEDIEVRLELVQRICEQLWSTEYFVKDKNIQNR